MNKEDKLYNLDKLSEIDTNTEFLKQIIEIFITTVPVHAKELLLACNEKNWEMVYFIAHKMKANINLLNIEKIKEEVLYVEQSAKSKTNLEALGNKIKFIDEVVQYASEQMREEYLG